MGPILPRLSCLLWLLGACGSCPVVVEHLPHEPLVVGTFGGGAAVLVPAEEIRTRVGHAEVCPLPRTWVERSELVVLSLEPGRVGEVLDRMPWALEDELLDASSHGFASFAEERTVGFIASRDFSAGDHDGAFFTRTPPNAPFPERAGARPTLISTAHGPVYARGRSTAGSLPIEVGRWDAERGTVWTYHPSLRNDDPICDDGSAARFDRLAPEMSASPNGTYVVARFHLQRVCSDLETSLTFEVVVLAAETGDVLARTQGTNRTLVLAAVDDDGTALFGGAGLGMQRLRAGGDVEVFPFPDEAAVHDLWAVDTGWIVRTTGLVGQPEDSLLAITADGDQFARAPLERIRQHVGADAHGVFRLVMSEPDQLCVARYDTSLVATEECASFTF